jgi:hypothetical protein
MEGEIPGDGTHCSWCGAFTPCIYRVVLLCVPCVVCWGAGVRNVAGQAGRGRVCGSVGPCVARVPRVVPVRPQPEAVCPEEGHWGEPSEWG